MSIIISAKNLSFKDIIRYPDINIEENKSTFIAGKSGCGKSTLLRLFNSTLIPSSGCVFYNEKNISEYDKIELRKNIILVPQEVFLIEGSIKDNFNFYYENREGTPPDSVAINKYLKLCCLDFSPDNVCTTMSGGERQRVFLAIFLSFLPKILLLDEPTSALDTRTSKELLQNIENFCTENGITSVSVCHSKELTDIFSDCTIQL